MKAKIELELKNVPLEKVHRRLLEFLQTLKELDIVEDGKIEIYTPDGIVTDKCILQNNKVVA